MKKFVIALVLVFVVLYCLVSCDSADYKKALELVEQEDYAAAYEKFEKLGNYNDSKEQLKHFYYIPTKIKAVVRDEGEEENATLEFFYNEQNLPLQGITTYFDGKSILDFSYDANGNVIKEIYMYPNGNKNITDYTYDANGNLIKEVYTNSDGDKNIHDYSYDANGNIIKEVYAYSDGYKDVYDYTYDSNGNLIKKTEKDSDGYLESYEIEYRLVYIPYSLSEETEELLSIEYWVD